MVALIDKSKWGVKNNLKLFVFGIFLFVTIGLTITVISLANQTTAASAPALVTYQGKLLANGSAVTTTQSMYFILYDAATNGNALYSAAGSVSVPSAINVTPNSGLFSVDLGDTGTNSLDPAIFRDNATLYLEVRIGSETLAPRKRITASPYAFNARYLDGVGASVNATTTHIPVSDSSGNFNFNHVTSTGIYASGTSTFSAVTLGGVTRTGWNGAYIGLTPISTYNGVFTFVSGLTTYRGYDAANKICNAAYSGSHFCRTDEIVATIADRNYASLFTDNGNGWIAEGPPGYTANSNDCNGWTSSSSAMLGAFWLYNTDGGGAGWLVNCATQKAISCCR